MARLLRLLEPMVIIIRFFQAFEEALKAKDQASVELRSRIEILEMTLAPVIQEVHFRWTRLR